MYLHHLPQLLRQFGGDDDVVASQLQHCAVSAAVLLLPAGMALLAHLALPIADMALQQAGVPLHLPGTQAWTRLDSSTHLCRSLGRAQRQPACTLNKTFVALRSEAREALVESLLQPLQSHAN